MGLLPKSAYETPVPELYPVRQTFDPAHVEDIEAEVRAVFARPEIARRIRPGVKTALLAGSRGIANIDRIVHASVDALKALGADPVIIPAMGSHGGATAEGQIEVLAGYGITEKAMGCPIESSMEVVQTGCVGDVKIYADKNAAACGAIIPIGRVKAHTDFKGPIESGLCKMLSIGIGKHVGCTSLHKLGFENFHWLIPEAAAVNIAKLPVIFGLAVIENAYEQTYRIEAVEAEKIREREPELLKIANANLPGLPFETIDLLIVEQLGKDISGCGMDPNVTGRTWCGLLPGFNGPAIKRILVTGLTERTHGNATGLGYADLTTRAVLDELDWHTTAINAISSGNPMSGKVPCVVEDEKEGILVTVSSTPGIDPANPRIVKIRSTLELTEFEVSEALLPEVRRNPRMTII